MPPLSWPVGASGPEKGSAQRKGFLLWLLYLVHIKRGQAGVLLFVFSLFSGRMTDGSWRCRRPVLQG